MVLVGYRMFNDIHYAITMANNNSSERQVIGDYDCSLNKVSEFLYKALETVQGYAIKR